MYNETIPTVYNDAAVCMHGQWPQHMKHKELAQKAVNCCSNTTFTALSSVVGTAAYSQHPIAMHAAMMITTFIIIQVSLRRPNLHYHSIHCQIVLIVYSVSNRS